MSRLGKIARLPRAVRDALNVRLQEGDSGPELLAWLNAAPGVPAVLAAHFEGKPINAQNLSDWRRGGYAAWCEQQQIFELAERLLEEKPELEAVITEEELAECFAQASAMALLRELKATWGMAEGPERRRAVLAFARAEDRLRRRQLAEDRMPRTRAKAASSVAQPPRAEAPPPTIKPAPRTPAPLAPLAAIPDEARRPVLVAAAGAPAAGVPDALSAAGRAGPKLPALRAA